MKQLHLSLQCSKCVILSGPSGSGKTTCFRILAAAYQYIRELRALEKAAVNTLDQQEGLGSHKFEYPTVNIVTINPGACTLNEVS